MMTFDYVLESANGSQRAEAWRTNEPVKVSQGYGGHPVGARPKRKALTVWEGRQPFMMTVPMLLFRGGPGHSVEGDRVAIERMAIIEDLTPVRTQVGVKLIAGPGVILPVPPLLNWSGEWWIEDIVWGEEIREKSGPLTRKELTVTLLERIDDVTLGEKPPSSSIPPGGVPLTYTYRVRKGDTLKSIALHKLGNVTRWTEIKALNPHIRSDGDLHPGKTVLRLPVGLTLISERSQPTSA